MTRLDTRPRRAWIRENPVLPDGELVCEKETGLLKIGDGVTAWADLKYVKTGAGEPAGSTSFSNPGEPGLATNGPFQELLSPPVGGVSISDTDAWAGTANGVTWQAPGADGEQSFRVQTGPAGEHELLFDADGSLTLNGSPVGSTSSNNSSAPFIGKSEAEDYAYYGGLVTLLEEVVLDGWGLSPADTPVTFDGIDNSTATFGPGDTATPGVYVAWKTVNAPATTEPPALQAGLLLNVSPVGSTSSPQDPVKLTATASAIPAGSESSMTFDTSSLPDGWTVGTDDESPLILPDGVWTISAAVYCDDAGEAAKTFQAYWNTFFTGQYAYGHLASMDPDDDFDASCPTVTTRSHLNDLEVAISGLRVRNRGAAAHDFGADVWFQKIA